MNPSRNKFRLFSYPNFFDLLKRTKQIVFKPAGLSKKERSYVIQASAMLLNDINDAE
jgi:hypothetical protein